MRIALPGDQERAMQLTEATNEELMEELGRRHESAVIVVRDPDGAEDHETICYSYGAGFHETLGMVEHVRAALRYLGLKQTFRQKRVGAEETAPPSQGD